MARSHHHSSPGWKSAYLGGLARPRTRAPSPLGSSRGETQSHIGGGGAAMRRGEGLAVVGGRLQLPFLGIAVPISVLRIVLFTGHYKPYPRPAG